MEDSKNISIIKQSNKIYKIVLIGDANCGKTCLAMRLKYNRFYEYAESTIGSAYLKIDKIIDNNKYELCIWDTAGQEKYRSITPYYYRNSDIILLCFNLKDNSLDSYNSLKKWLKDIYNSYIHPVPKIFILGLKLDIINPDINLSNIITLCEINNIEFIKISSKINIGVDILEKTLIEYIKINELKNIYKDEILLSSVNLDSPNNISKCC